jgi:hypothetical protein
MKTCPHCEALINSSAVRCPACGRLIAQTTLPIHSSETNYQSPTVIGDEIPFPRIEKLPILDKGEIALIISGSPHLIRMTVKQPIILGRNFSKDSLTDFQLDLAALDAHDLGVSRHHARLEKMQGSVYLIDLDSSNGTLLNDERLKPHKPYLVLNGARIQLGRLKMLLFCW